MAEIDDLDSKTLPELKEMKADVMAQLHGEMHRLTRLLHFTVEGFWPSEPFDSDAYFNKVKSEITDE